MEALRGWTILLGGEAVLPDPTDDYEDRPAIAGFSVFEDSRVRTVKAPLLAVGGIAAYESVRIQHLDTGAGGFLFGDASRVTASSRFALTVPEGWSYEVVARRADRVEIVRRERGFEAGASGLGSLPREEMRPPASELLPLVQGRWWSPGGERGFLDWNAVGRWYSTLTSAVLRERGEVPAIAQRLAPREGEDPLAAIARAYAFASRDVRYVSIQIGIGGYKPHTPADVCRNRFGDCKDKTFLLRAILEEWGLATYAVLARLRDGGPVDPDLPSPGQFDHCIAAVRLPNGSGADLWGTVQVPGLGRLALLDPTAREADPWSLPTGVQGTLGLLVHPSGGHLVEIPSGPPAAARAVRTLRARVDDAGALAEAVLVERWEGTHAGWIRGQLASRSEAERSRWRLEQMQSFFPGARVLSETYDGISETDRAVAASVRLEGGRLGHRVGDLLVIEPARAAVGPIARTLPPPPRTFPLDLESRREEEISADVQVPTGWVPESLPSSLSVDSPFLRASGTWSFAEGTLSYRRTASLLVTEVSKDAYPAFRDAVARVQTADATAVAFVRAP